MFLDGGLLEAPGSRLRRELDKGLHGGASLLDVHAFGVAGLESWRDDTGVLAFLPWVSASSYYVLGLRFHLISTNCMLSIFCFTRT